MKLKREAFLPCIAKIAARGRITPAEAEMLLQETADRAEIMRQTGEPDAFVKAAGELAENVKINAQRIKLDALRNAVKREAIHKEIEAAGGIKNAYETLAGDMVSSLASRNQDSVQVRGRGITGPLLGVVSWKIRSIGAEKLAISGAMDKEIAMEMAGKSTGNKLAKELAEALAPPMEHIRQRLNAAGANIAKATDFIAHTSHDPYLLRRAAGSVKDSVDDAFKAWWDFVTPKLDAKTYENITPKPGESMPDATLRFGRGIYEALVTGVHMSSEGTNGIKLDGFTPHAYEGSRNLAKALSHARVLMWKGPEEWHGYMQKFGYPSSLTHSVLGSIQKAGNQIALMERYGTNPMASLKTIIEQTERKYRSIDPDGVAAFGNQKAYLEQYMAQLDGSANIASNQVWAEIGRSVRTAETTATLGGVGVTHATSALYTVPLELRHHGVGTLATFQEIARQIFRGRSSAEAKELAGQLGAYSDGLLRDASSVYNPDFGRPGLLSSIANTYMKYTGLPYILNGAQAATRFLLSHNLGQSVGKVFEKLDAMHQIMLESYGIGPKEWNLMRSVPELDTLNGNKYLTGRNLANMDVGKIEQNLRAEGMLKDDASAEAVAAAVGKYRTELIDKLNGYYSDTAYHSTITPGARERGNSFFGGSTRPGDPWHEAAKYVMQFKIWAFAAWDQSVRRELYMNTSKSTSAWGLGLLLSTSTVAGYMRMTIRDWAAGNPRRELTPRTMLAALTQGGGAGIFGDFLFGETNRMGGGFLSTLAGPVIGDVAGIANIFQKFMKDANEEYMHPDARHKNGFYGDLWPDLAHFGVRHIPFANLVYLKGTLDYMMWYHLFEASNPGWWERTNHRLHKEQGREMTGYSPGSGVPWGMPGIYLKNNSGETSGLFGAH